MGFRSVIRVRTCRVWFPRNQRHVFDMVDTMPSLLGGLVPSNDPAKTLTASPITRRWDEPEVHLAAQTNTCKFSINGFPAAKEQCLWTEEPIFTRNPGILDLAVSMLARYANVVNPCAERCGNPVDIAGRMIDRIKAAGFINVKHHDYKVPIESWPKHPAYKDAGTVNLEHWKDGIEGWSMWLLTKFGAPEPWSADQVKTWVEEIKKDLENPHYHAYSGTRRVWAQKPFDAKKKEATA